MTPADFIARIEQAKAAGTPLLIRGGGSKDWYGHSGSGELLDTTGYTGIIEYDPSELVVTARCGTRLADLERALAAEGQMLAFEPPAWSEQSTLGGVVASGLSGPRRAYAGALRDFMLGTVILNGQGELLRFGGQVMKNVAGYDVARLMAGSLGCLGLILEVSLKVLPVPEQEITLAFELDQYQALQAMQRWRGQALPVSATSWQNGPAPNTGLALVRLSGSGAAVHSAMQRMGGTTLAPSTATGHWHSLREQTHAFFSDTACLWRISVPADAPMFDAGAPQLIEWGGAQRWVADPQRGAAQLREDVAALGGHATLFRGGDKSVGVFQPLPEPLLRIHHRLKSAFDPQHLFNPGRLYPEL